MKIVLFCWLLLVSSLTWAQTSKTDVLYKLDRSPINVKIDELTDTDIVYMEPSAPQLKKTIARTQVWKIVFSDGSTEIITPPAGQVPTGTTTPQPTATAAPVPDRTRPTPTLSENDSAPSASYTNPGGFARIHLTIGPEFAYYPDFINKGKAWLNDSTGFGMTQNVGASLRFDYRFIRRVAVSATAGYYGWELVRKYTRNSISEFYETKKLTQIPVQLGLKFYPVGSFYVMPEGGVTLLFSSVKTSDNHPTPANESVNAMPITYGASVGCEIMARSLLLDLSIRYQFLNVNNLSYTAFNQSLNEQVNIASIRLGIGFNAVKK
ncbi:hypothetical protein [Spirosoma sp.]|uniref:hypothetical protein n=1 Tax=Spirosoma sp. TaxID=1899569 RepID=UPI00261BAEED|nr:hypothetical protein [Spirosoma sp.]MCX6214605.1 hypothetical protein [Spirosoma sp.]